MQTINSSFNNLALGTGSNAPVSPAHAKNRVNPVAGKETVEKQDKSVKTEQELTSQKQAQQHSAKQSQQKQSFELDEATLAFLEKNQEQHYQEQSTQGQSQLVQKNDSSTNFSSENEFIAKDHISSQNQTAVSSYQQVGNLAQRESVQQLLGIDLYA